MTEQITFYAAFLIGLFSSVHCFAMCGGIATLLSNQSEVVIRQPRQNLYYMLASNLGRITSYTLFGAIAGLLSAGLTVAANTIVLADSMRIVTGVLLILMGLQMASNWKGLHIIEAIGKPVWNKLSPFVQQLLPITTLRTAFLWGVLWGWLPCSMVYTLLVMALASGDVISGSVIMLAFGLGTLPALLLTGMVAMRVITWLQRKPIKCLAAFLFLVAGIWVMAMPYFRGHLMHQGIDMQHYRH